MVPVFVGIKPRAVSSGRQMMKEKSLVNVTPQGLFVRTSTGRTNSWNCGGENPIGHGHAVVGKSGRSNVNSMGSNGRFRFRFRCRGSRIAGRRICIIGIVGVINGGSRPMGRWGRLGLVPIAADRVRSVVVVVIVVVVAGTTNMVQNASKSPRFQQGCHSVVQWNTPEVCGFLNVLPFGICIVLGSLLVEIPANHDWNPVGFFLQQVVYFGPPCFCFKGVEMRSHHPAASVRRTGFHQQTQCRSIVG
mmetsp:Transcript_10921/g.27672  ORF Transcript_10921/g.27672 Transcript_10921/m.27672 type:complete len:247 (-) Transcript_10921:201-941(-)